VLALLTTRVHAGRPLLVARVTDGGSGVDPTSLVLSYHGFLIGVDSYDPDTGLALFPIPPSVPPLAAGGARVTLGASDFQETKNVNTLGPSVMPNTRRVRLRLTAVTGATVTWLSPAARGCVRGAVELLLAADTRPRILDGTRTIGPVAQVRPGLYRATWRPKRKGRHLLRALAGRRGTAERLVRVGCP
jgi:hypothetical protein